MPSRHPLFAIALVVLGHIAAIAGLLQLDMVPAAAITEPVIQGVMITPVAVEKPAPVSPPSPKSKPAQTPKPVEKKKKPAETPIPLPEPVAEASSPTEAPPADPVPATETSDSAPANDSTASETPPEAPVEPPRTDARHYRNPAPTYPRISRRLGEEGTVVMEILITPEGTVAEARLKKSSGFSRLDKAALDIIKKWKYIPAMQGGKAISYWYTQPVTFDLN